MYVSNDRISLSLTELVDNVDTNLDDLELFMDYTTKVRIMYILAMPSYELFSIYFACFIIMFVSYIIIQCIKSIIKFSF